MVDTVKRKSKINPFKNYLAFLKKQNDLTQQELAWLETPASDFIQMIKKTAMSKTYKLPTFLAFLCEDELLLKIDDERLYQSFKAFYSQGSNAIDLLRDKSTKNFKQWEKAEFVKLARKNPVHFLCQSKPDFFSKDETSMYLTDKLLPYQNDPSFIEHVKDAIELRKQEFYKNRLDKLN